VSEKSIEDRLNEPTPVAIKLKPGDVFAGDFDHLEKGETEYGTCWVAVFANPAVDAMLEPPEISEDGVASLWLFHEALLSRFKRLRPAKGDHIAVKHLGKKMGGNGREYNAYSVISDREQAGEFTWDEVDPLQPEDRQTGPFNDPPPF
jgi:hypothetical protein